MEENKSQSKKQSEPPLSEEELTSDSVEESEIKPRDCCTMDCEDQLRPIPPPCGSSTPLSEDTESCSNDDE